MTADSAPHPGGEAGKAGPPAVDLPAAGRPRPDRNKGGRPTNEERRRRRIERLLESVANADLIAAEAAVKVLEDPKTQPAVKVQAMNFLAAFRPRATEAAKGAGVPAEALEVLRKRLELVESVLLREEQIEAAARAVVVPLLEEAP